MAISVRFSEQDEAIVKAYANLNNISLSDFIRNAVLEKIEDEYDLKVYEKAMEEHRKNPVTYTLDEVEREIFGNV